MNAAARRRRPRTPLVLGLFVVALGLACAASLLLGSRPTSLAEIADALRGQGSPQVQAVLDSRVPRTVVGLVAGACLGVCGVLAQSLTRNPLGDPGLLGVNAGAAAAIVTASAFTSLGSQVWVAMPGAVLALVLVVLVGGGAASTPLRIVLAGAVVTALLGAYVQAVTLTHPRTFDGYRWWAVGSLSGGMPRGSVLLVGGLGLVAALALARSLDTLALGDETAAALGTSPARVRVLGLGVVALLAAAATTAAGPIAFLGLAAPHLARALVGQGHLRLIPVAALLGPVVLLVSDVLGRVVARPAEIQVGVVTAALGGVLLLALVRARVVSAS